MIYIDREHSRLRSYSATTKGGKSIVRIEVEVNDPHELGFLLKELGELQNRQATRPAERKPARKALGRGQLRLLPPPGDFE